jgi:hypothetical protein
MELDLDTFLTIVYCTVDEVYQQHFAPAKPLRPGRHPELHDSEVITLMLVAQWHPSRSERKVGRYAARHWRAYFPRLLSQSQFNRRVRDLHGAFARLAPLVAEHLIATLQLEAAYEVLDGVPVPVMARCRGNRHRCFANEASIGRGGSDREWYYGLQLLLTVTPCGLITGFMLGPAGTEERWVADALLRWRVQPTAPAPTLAELRPVVRTDHAWRPAVGPTGPLGPAVRRRFAARAADPGGPGLYRGRLDPALAERLRGSGLDESRFCARARRRVLRDGAVVQRVAAGGGDRQYVVGGALWAEAATGAELLGGAHAGGGEGGRLQSWRGAQSSVWAAHLCLL